MESYERLITYNIKPSMQRMAIMDYLVEHRTHPSADEIYTALSPVMPTLSRTTVHNTLRLFAEQGAALMLTIDERNTNFDADTSAHAHFLCKECGKIYDLKSKLDTKVTEEFQSEGNEITEMHYYYKGICKNCLEHIID
ncbi:MULTISPECIES: transcriptional repressor [Bacteroides]|uniref:Fur family transcriptional regulator n=1 Tax=Bacteroides TaxID=816 RepID=UPI0005A69EDD|nr:transcriptional repressor [Bacteroides neonati]